MPHKVDTGLHQGTDCHSLSCSLPFEICFSPPGATHGGFTCKVLLRFLFFVLRTLPFAPPVPHTVGGRWPDCVGSFILCGTVILDSV